jgi:hypothetical protein
MSSVSELISNSKFSAATVSVGPLPLPSTTPSARIFFFGGGGVISLCMLDAGMIPSGWFFFFGGGGGYQFM